MPLRPVHTPLAPLAAAAVLACAASNSVHQPVAASMPSTRSTAQAAPGVQGAWRVIETAARVPGEAWIMRPGPQAGLYVFATQYYSYFYVPGVQPRPRFANPNGPTETEKAAAYDSFIAGAGTYTFDGRVLALKADLRKNPNEMTGDVWRFQTEAQGDTMRLVFTNPPFLPGREWRTTLVRIE